MPTRIQRKRTKGWRMPEGARYVGRPSWWGNDWRPGDVCNYTIHANALIYPDIHHPAPIVLDRVTAIAHYRRGWAIPQRRRIQDDLRGRDLACWCPLDQPCHADVLLELANR
jgi:hypothetical protein